jgi:excinuclease ABC subunit A
MVMVKFWRGFYQKESWIFYSDIHGTYTQQVVCPECNGAGLRPEYLAVTLQNKNMFELSEMPLLELEKLVKKIPEPHSDIPLAETSLQIIRRRLRFLRQVGIGYLHLNRPTGTLSAGEAQMHPSELEALLEALEELRDEGNTVIVVEHDLLLIRAADHVIDLGPGAGTLGGRIVSEGKPADIIKANTITGKWLQKDQLEKPAQKGGLLEWMNGRQRRHPHEWMVIEGARTNNLRGEDVKFPLETFTGVCGVSGSGKSSLLIDTVGRALVKQLHTSSFAREPLEAGEYEEISNPPKRTLLVDQSRRGIQSPASYLDLTRPLFKIFLNSDDAQALELGEKDLTRRCTACRGRGQLRLDMGFLPNEFVECETCKGTGYRPEAWDVRVKGVSLPDINSMTLDEVYDLFKDEKGIAEPLEIVRQVGLGYLVWRQYAYTLSGGEVQRLKIAKELIKKTREKTLYIMDEPTVGLHMDDVARLAAVLNRLVDEGHSVIVVEHHPHLLAFKLLLQEPLKTSQRRRRPLLHISEKCWG